MNFNIKMIRTKDHALAVLECLEHIGCKIKDLPEDITDKELIEVAQWAWKEVEEHAILTEITQ